MRYRLFISLFLRHLATSPWDNGTFQEFINGW